MRQRSLLTWKSLSPLQPGRVSRVTYRGRWTLWLLALLILSLPAEYVSLHAQVPAADYAPVGAPAADPRSVEAQAPDIQLIFQLTNEDRAAQGLGPLSWSPELASAALAHARRIAAAAGSELSHRYPGEPELATRAAAAGAHFSSIAENIAQGGAARSIEKQWMTSVPHRTNILDPHMNALGVAIFASGGTLYAVEDFAATQASLTAGQIEAQVAATLHALAPEGAALESRPADEARAYCTHPSSTTARFELVWEGADLSLPGPLTTAVRSGQYHAASIGACPAQGDANRSFTVYRTAVLLY